MNKQLLIFKKPTDAVSTNRGFYYQYLKTLQIWILASLNHEDIEIHCETDDDIQLIDRAAELVSLKQIKSFSTGFSLESDDIQKSIYNFFMLFLVYGEEYAGTFHFETNSHVVKTDGILKRWVASQGTMDATLLKDCTSKIKPLLLENLKKDRDQKILLIEKSIKKFKAAGRGNNIEQLEQRVQTISETYGEILGHINNESLFERFLGNIRWEFANVDPEEAVDQLYQDNIRYLKMIPDISAAPHIMQGRLLTEVQKRSTKRNTSERVLDTDLFSSIISESIQEMTDNTDGILLAFMDSRFSRLESKVDMVLSEVSRGNSVDLATTVSMYSLPYFEEEEIRDFLENTEDSLYQSNLERKISSIKLPNEADEQGLIEIATTARCSYLLYLEQLRLSNLSNAYKELKALERKVRERCSSAVLELETAVNFDPVIFWTELRNRLYALANNHSKLKNIDIDDEVVIAQMYHIAAECHLRWDKAVVNNE